MTFQFRRFTLIPVTCLMMLSLPASILSAAETSSESIPKVDSETEGTSVADLGRQIDDIYNDYLKVFEKLGISEEDIRKVIDQKNWSVASSTDELDQMETKLKEFNYFTDQLNKLMKMIYPDNEDRSAEVETEENMVQRIEGLVNGSNDDDTRVEKIQQRLQHAQETVDYFKGIFLDGDEEEAATETSTE